MQVENYLKKYQPILYKTFLNAYQENHLSHAYLISGTPGTPLFDVAKFLAKSLLCDEPSPLACDNCITCLRIDDNNYPDFIVLDGSKSNILKGDVEKIQTQFEKTAFEEKGIMIYIIHLVENMNVESVNTLLKFLEEPGSQIYAFLTTNNENYVLPTIISRCQILRLKQINRKQIIDEAIELGADSKDAEILSFFYNNSELIIELLNNEDEKEEYINAKNSFDSIVDSLLKDNKASIAYNLQKNILPNVKTKESIRFFLDLLIQLFKDVLNYQNNNKIMLESYSESIINISKKIKNVDSLLIEILRNRNLVNLNLNISLLVDHITYLITGAIYDK